MGDLEKQERVGENERLLEGMPVLDFDMLCSSVALQSAHGSWGKLGGGDEEQQGGVLRMWEGELLDCFDDRRIAFESALTHYFLYPAVALIIVVGAYLGFYRTRMRKKFNIKESRTLEINNVQNGTWHGRGDIICIGDIRENKALYELRPPSIVSIKSTDENCMEKSTDVSNGS
ncbi:hypothetical protein JHK85_042235 [Glycine max]|nr:hypothetical protein JHK85_042235 [Glycine max]